MGTRRSSKSRGGTAEDLRRLALARPGAIETLTWGAPHFRVSDRIFAGIGMREGRAVTSVKLEKSHAEARLLDPRFRPAPYVGRYGWVEFALEDVTPGELEALVEESHRLVGKGKTARPKQKTAAGRN
jgi:predicted DNA-binding protein (MmcQ/YjbR family)